MANRPRKNHGVPGTIPCPQQQFGKCLRERRKRASLTLQQLGRQTHISVQLLSVVENAYAAEGRRPIILSDTKMKAVSEALDWSLLDMNRILGRIPDGENVFHAPAPKRLESQLRNMTPDQFNQAKDAFLREMYRREVYQGMALDDYESPAGADDPGDAESRGTEIDKMLNCS